MASVSIDTCLLEKLSNLHISDKKGNNPSSNASLSDNNNMSLESLLCENINEPGMDEFTYNKNDCLEDFLNVDIYVTKINSLSSYSRLYDDPNISLEYLLCDNINEGGMDKLVYNKNDCRLEDFLNLHIYDKKINDSSSDSSLCADTNLSLESLCHDTNQLCMDKFVYNKNDCCLEDFSNLHIYDNKINDSSSDSSLCRYPNLSLESLCHDSSIACMDKFVYNKMSSKNLKMVEPSSTYILSDENKFFIKLSTDTKLEQYDSKKEQKYSKPKSSLFYKALTAKVKIKKAQRLKLQQIKTNLHLYEPNSWYSVNLLVSLANSKYLQKIQNLKNEL